MIIRSKTKTIAFWVGPIMVIFFIGMLVLSISYGSAAVDGVTPIILSMAFLIIGITQCYQLKLIEVDTVAKTVKITRILTWKHSLYNFSDIDGLGVTVVAPARGMGYRVLSLFKNGLVLQKISGNYYSNFTEIETGLKDIGILWEKAHRII